MKPDTDIPWIPGSAAVALADAWASIDGKLEQFRAGRDVPSIHQEPGGYFTGYLIEAEEMIKRLARRGYIVMPMPGDAA